MYNLIEYSKNYRNTTGSLRNYDRDEPTNSITNEQIPNLLKIEQASQEKQLLMAIQKKLNMLFH